MRGEQVQLVMGDFRTELAMQILVKQGRLMVLDEEQLLFIIGEQANTFDDNVDEAPIQDLALNEENVFQADQCDAFDFDVDEAPTAQTMFMVNLSSADPIFNEAGPSYDLDILSEVQDHDNYLDNVGKYHEVHEIQNDVQPNCVVDSDVDYMSDSNIIPYEQYVKDNAEQVVQSNVSSVPTDALIMIINDMHEQATQCISANEHSKVVNASLTAELARYKEQVELYERRARFELNEHEQKIDEQLRIIITDRNIKKETLKKELYSVKIQLNSTINHNKSMVEEVTTLKKDFKQKEDVRNLVFSEVTIIIDLTSLSSKDMESKVDEGWAYDLPLVLVVTLVELQEVGHVRLSVARKSTLRFVDFDFGSKAASLNHPSWNDLDLELGSFEENGVIRTKKYAELSAAEKIQVDCDMKATNIILQGTSLTKQERECKLYDAFDKFTHIKGESLPLQITAITQLINDMNIYKMNMEQFQVNTKFLNSLPPEWSFAVPVFSLRDDPIACLNKAMAFLRTVASSRFPTTNNQLRTSSNSRNQATIQDGRVTVQQVQGRQGQNYFGTTYKSNAISSRGNNTSGQTRVVKFYNCQDCDDLSHCTSSFMANISNYGSDIISEATVQDTHLQAQQDSMILSMIEQMSAELERYKEMVKMFEQRLNIDLSSREKMIDSQMDDMIREKIALKEQINSLEQNLSKQIKEKESLFETFSIFKNESKEKEDKYMENEIDLEKKIKELDNIICKVGQSAQTRAHVTEPQACFDNTHKQALVPSELPKVSLVNASLKKLKFHLTQFDSVVKKRTTPNALEEGE
ncbi:hypothetical protein Tco_0839245 [Tanacetum coccineum]|uniref:Integrase, catalytic region, zinc finger, CCHC-type, peptidase aspartic, catalytic n=1 Tax=Tanacetum coccineum TaxID=301880 RepID=A0ABQ5AU24_9ASTR